MPFTVALPKNYGGPECKIEYKALSPIKGVFWFSVAILCILPLVGPIIDELRPPDHLGPLKLRNLFNTHLQEPWLQFKILMD